MKVKLCLLILCTILAFACNQQDAPKESYNKQSAFEQDSLNSMTASLDSLVKKGGGPCDTGSDCMEVSIHWPVVHGGDEKIRKIINDSIYKFVLNNLEYNPEWGNISMEQVADTMISYYAIEYKNNKAFDTGWSMEVSGEMEFHDNIGVLQLFNYSYMGGAHPNHFTQYFNFNTRTGEIINYADFVIDTTAFKSLVENKFLAEASEKTDEEASIEAFFWGDGFQLPQNFRIGKDNFEMIYNPYEAAAYVYGAFPLEFSYAELEGIIDLSTVKDNKEVQ